MHQYAREAYNVGIRFIGGCCGFEPYHIRAVAEELATERGILPAASEKHGMWGAGLEMHTKPWVRARWVSPKRSSNADTQRSKENHSLKAAHYIVLSTGGVTMHRGS